MAPPLPYRLASTPGKGLGLFAARPITTGELLVSESPLFIANSDATIEAAVAALSPEDQATFFTFGSHHPVNPTSSPAIFWGNALPAGPDNMGGMYTTLCRINHSCLPNVHHTWSESLGRLAVFARTDIPEGDELYICYVPHCRSRKIRQSHISQHFYFTCGCSVCSGPVNRESDARRERINNLATLHIRYSHNPAVSLRYIKERLRLMDEEGLHDLGERAADHYSGAKIGAVWSDFDTVRRQMGLAYAHRVLHSGVDDAWAKKMLVVYRAPETHELAGEGDRDRVLPSICDACGEQGTDAFEGSEDGGGECDGCRCSIYCSASCREGNAARHKAVCAVLQAL